MKLLGLVGALLVVVVVGYMAIFPSARVRYRLTLEAEVEGRPAAGSGVIEVRYAKNLKLLPNESEFHADIRGEAVVLDVGKRGSLFALLKGGPDSRSGAEWIVLRAFNFPGGALPYPVEEGLNKIRTLSGRVELTFQSLPLFVRFRDTNDPKSVEKVDPLDLEKSFGAGVMLKRATLEIVPAGIWPLSAYGITGEPITNGIDSRLPWLRGLKGGYLDGAFAGGGPALSNILFGGDFSVGK